MNWLTPVLSFIVGMLETLVAPFIAFITGKKVQELKQEKANSKQRDKDAKIDAESDADKSGVVDWLRNRK